MAENITGYDYAIGTHKGFHVVKPDDKYGNFGSFFVKMCTDYCDIVSIYTRRNIIRDRLEHNVTTNSENNIISITIPRSCDTFSDFRFKYDTCKKGIQFSISIWPGSKKMPLKFTRESQLNILNFGGVYLQIVIELPIKYNVNEFIKELEILYIEYYYETELRRLLYTTLPLRVNLDRVGAVNIHNSRKRYDGLFDDLLE